MANLTVAVLSLVLSVFVVNSVQAQDCTPRRLQEHSGWYYNVADAWSRTVPAGEVWEVWRAGLASNDPAWVETRLQVEEPVLSQNNQCCWKIPFTPATNPTSATPKTGWSGTQYLFEGQRIHGRANQALGNIAVLFSGIKYPEACLARRLGLEAPVVVSSSGGPVEIPNWAAQREAGRLLIEAANALRAVPPPR